MNIKEFSYYVEEHIRDYLPEEIRETAGISVYPVRGINDMLQYGIRICQEGKGSLAFPLENAWRAYQDGMEMETILVNLVQIYGKYRCNFAAEAPKRDKRVRNSIIFQVVNKEANQASLKERIYTDIGQGLVKVYAIYQKLNASGTEGNIPITHGIMRDYGLNVQMIRDNAEKNTPWIYPAVFMSLFERLFGVKDDKYTKENLEECYILSNLISCWGAGALFYPDMPKKIAERLENNYYVIPSSLHEVLIMPESTKMTKEEMEQMLQTINGETVSKEDFLSNKVLFYDREKEQLRIAMPEIPDLQIEEKKGVARQ